MTQSRPPRRQQIEDVASALFRERGYAGTSVRDIAQALNLQGGSLYAHMASKEDVLWSIVTRAADRFNAQVGPIAARDQRVAGRPAARDDPRPRRGRDQHPAGRRRLPPRVALPVAAERRELLAARRDAYEGLFRKVIAEGIGRRCLPAVDPRLTAMAILSALNGIATWYRPTGALTSRADRRPTRRPLPRTHLETAAMTDPLSLAPDPVARRAARRRSSPTRT